MASKYVIVVMSSNVLLFPGRAFDIVKWKGGICPLPGYTRF